MVRNNHDFDVPEHPVIFAMERYGEYPWPKDSFQLTADSGQFPEGKTSLGTNFTSKKLHCNATSPRKTLAG